MRPDWWHRAFIFFLNPQPTNQPTNKPINKQYDLSIYIYLSKKNYFRMPIKARRRSLHINYV